MLHAHLDRTATDCDGRIDDSRILVQNDEERADQFGDISFEARMVGSLVNTYSILNTGSLEVTRFDSGTYDVKVEWSEETEEGYVHATILFCKDEDCDLGETSHRDHFAEAAGY